MSFANSYIAKIYDRNFAQAPILSSLIEMIVVIPCFDEPDLDSTLNSLFTNHFPGCNTAVLVVINDAENAESRITAQNRKTLSELENNVTPLPNWISLHWLYAQKLPSKWAGAGWARKIGMDWAITHYNRNNNSEGLIVSLDADTLVETNYLYSIYNFFKINKKPVAATLYFEHQLPDDLKGKQTEAILLYELYMRYYRNAQLAIGFPGAIYTVGSCFVVKAKAYVAQGGMNRRKAGEDFYFLHKIIEFGEVGEINATCVYPSSRISNRVPFGTGPSLTNHLRGSSDLHFSYPLQAFIILKDFFSQIELFFEKKDHLQIEDLHSNAVFIEFAKHTNLLAKIVILANNCSSITHFRRRFFHLFDAFQLLKWLNFAASQNYPKTDLLLEVNKLMELIQSGQSKLSFNQFGLLQTLRTIDRQKE